VVANVDRSTKKVKPMKLVRSQATVALALVATLVFGTAAQAATTLEVVTSGTSTAATSIAAGDNLDVNSTAPIPGVGVSDAEISNLWSHQSLQVKPASTVTYPEGWSLQYTTDGTNWTNTAPSPLSLAAGVRTKGNVESTGPNAFKTHPASTLIQSQRSFTGAAGGDGYDLTFAEDRVYNQFHHDLNLEVQCHMQSTGNACTGITVAGYQTPNGASSFYDSATKKLYALVMETASHDFGFMCINLATIATPALCGVSAAASFVNLYNGNGTTDAYREFMGSSSQDADRRVWTFNGANYSLMCLDLATGAACATHNGKVLAHGSTPMVGSLIANSGRVSAIDHKIYYVTDNKFGCYDPTTSALCGAGVTVAVANQYPPFPIRNASGTVLGACLYVTKVCITGSESAVAMPANLLTFINGHTIPAWNTYNAGQWAEIDNKLYLNKGPDIDASSNVYCFDFTTSADCAGFSGANVGTQIYAIVKDPTVPNCLWTNGNAGLITTFNGITGVAGCEVGSPVARMPYSALTPRMSCSEAGRVTLWSSIQFTVPAGITLGSSGNLHVTIFDETTGTETAITGFTNITVDSSGVLDLTPFNTGSSTAIKRATIEITAGAVSAATLRAVSAEVQYQADSPQLCLTLLAKATCANFTPANGDTTVPDGLIQVASVMTPATGSAITESHLQTLTGTNAGTICAAALPSAPPSTPTPPAPSVPVPSLSLAKSQVSSDPTYPGEEIAYSVIAKNDGETDLAGVSIADPGATLKDCTPSMPVAKLLMGQEIRCTAVRIVSLADVLAGSISNTATVSADDGTHAASNTVLTNVKNAPGLTVVKKQISAAPKQVGDLVRYSIVATNTGNTLLGNVHVIDKNAVIDFCSPSIPVAALKPGSSITCGATHVVTAADIQAGRIINVAIAKSDDLTASSTAATSAQGPLVNTIGQIDSNSVVTSIIGASVKGTKPAVVKPAEIKTNSAGVKSPKPSGELAYTGSSTGNSGWLGLILLTAGIALVSVRRNRRVGNKS
jgi:LPXTG-motif cell wall-anchored protein